VTLQTPNPEPSLFKRIDQLESAIKTDSDEAYKEFCKLMSQFQEEGDAFTDKDRETWRFLQVMFEKSREHMLDFLGFMSDSASRTSSNNDRLSKLEEKLMALKLKEDEAAEARPPISLPFSLYHPGIGGKTTEDQDVDTLITRHCILGEFEKAVNVCLAANRLSDALVIAISGGPELLQKTQREYFRRKSGVKSYVRVLQSVVDGNYEDVVANVKLDDSGEGWKDVMAFVATFASSSELAQQFSILGSRLAEGCRSPDGKRSNSALDLPKKEQRSHAAALCYIGAGDLEKAVDVWTRREVEEEKTLLKQTHSRTRLSTHVTALESLMEKVMVLRKAINYVDPSVNQSNSDENDGNYPLSLLYSHLAEYSELLCGLGKLELAWSSLEMIPSNFQTGVTDSVDSLQTLRDRVFHGLDVRNKMAPNFPFETTEIVSAEEVQQAQAPAQQQQQQQQPAYQQQQYYGQQQQQPYPSSANYYGGQMNGSYGYQSNQPSYGTSSGYGTPYNAPPPQPGYGVPPPQPSYGSQPPAPSSMGYPNAPGYTNPGSVVAPPPPSKPTLFQPPTASAYPSAGNQQQQPWMPPSAPSPVSRSPLSQPIAPPPVSQQQQQPWVPPVARPPQQVQNPMMPPNLPNQMNGASTPSPAPPAKPATLEMPAEFKDIEEGFKKQLEFLKSNTDMVIFSKSHFGASLLTSKKSQKLEHSKEVI
jgi:protein transport protein SEC31